MIRIETTAEFDAEGRFTGKLLEAVSPGAHRVIVVVEERDSTNRTSTMIDENGLLLLNVEPVAAMDLDITKLIEANRDERIQDLLNGISP